MAILTENIELYLREIVADLDAWMAVHRSQFDYHIQSFAFLCSTAGGCLKVVGEKGSDSE